MALTYSIVGGPDAGKFTINSTTGDLSFISPPDFENPTDADRNNIYQVTVACSDGIDTTTQDISVTVSNVNENKPPRFTSQATATIPENTKQVMKVTAVDDDDVVAPPPPPPVTGWPDATNTGAKGTLTTFSGNLLTSANGQIIENRNVSGSIIIRNGHSDVVIRNCRAQHIVMVDGNGNVSAGPRCIVEDCTITGSGTPGATGIQAGSAGGWVQRNDVSGVENGINVEAINGCIVFDNYIHDQASPGNPDPHYDCIVVQGGQSNVLIEHNNCPGQPGLSAVMFIKNDFGSISNIRVNNNRFIGGGFTCYSDNAGNAGNISGVEYTNNRLGGWVYGPLFIQGPYPVWSGNVEDATGNPIAAP